MEDDDIELPPVLCDECSDKLTSGKNWLGTLPLDGSFECIVCHQLCCSHLKGPDGLTCLECV